MLLQALIELFELPQDTATASDDIPLMDPDADNAGYANHCFLSVLFSVSSDIFSNIRTYSASPSYDLHRQCDQLWPLLYFA